MNDNNEGNRNTMVVKSAGDSWIICRSKSYKGRIYYFNTETGHAAWNLSNAEIERAKTTTRILENQVGKQFEGCPEPKEPPTDQVQQDTSSKHVLSNTPSQIYNKHFINNRFTNDDMYPMLASVHYNGCNPVNDSHNMSLNLPSPNTTFSVFSTARCNPQKNINLPGPSSFNPNIWNIQPQIFLEPMLPSHSNQMHGVANVTYNLGNNHADNSPITLSKRFQSLRRPKGNFGGVKKFYHNAFAQRGRQFQNAKHDLRQKLAAKRGLNQNGNFQQDEKPQKEMAGGLVRYPDTENILYFDNRQSQKEDVSASNVDSNWLENHIYIKGTHPTLDITSLKVLAKSGVNTDKWYIAVDTKVLLGNLHFLTILLNSDKNCHLMVPPKVMAELENNDKEGPMPISDKSRRVLKFINEQIEAGTAYVGNLPSGVINLKMPNILNCCMDLVKRNYHVILISNEPELHKYKDTTAIPILSIKDIQNLIDSYNNMETAPVKEANPIIKITINNDLDANENDMSHKSIETQVDLDVNLFGNGYQHKEDINIPQGDVLASVQLKEVADAGVQTDFPLLTACIPTIKNTNDSVNAESAILNDDIKETISDKVIASGNTTETKVIKTKLKRNCKSDSTTDNIPLNTQPNASTKKIFRWRSRRKLPSTNAIETDCSMPNNDQNIKAVPASPVKNSQSKNFLSNDTCVSIVTSYEDTMTDSELSLVTPINQSAALVVDETDTSGIISNTASNVDTESLHSTNICKATDVALQTTGNINQQAMFEITTGVMEDCLRTRVEEWVSRFVQIMEEVLTQVLEHHPQFADDALPPPWDIYDATKCIKKKFANNPVILNAAVNMNKTLVSLTDQRGNIKKDLLPSEYMEMYSYGVHLVEALQSEVSSKEDLYTASESLAKLIKDIQEPNVDISHNESFNDNMEIPTPEYSELSDRDSEVTKNMRDKNQVESISSRTVGNKSLRSKLNTPSPSKISGVYNLRSNKKIQEQEKEHDITNVKFIRNIDVEENFFNNLNLEKRSNNNRACISEKLFVPNHKIDMPEPKVTLEPKIIRNFTLCSIFEERLKNIQKQTIPMNYLGLDYNDFDNYDEDDYYTDQDYSEDDVETYGCDDDGKSDFKWVIENVLNEIKQAFLEVNSFCMESRNDIDELDKYPEKKSIIKDKTMKAFTHLQNIKTCLNSIYDRESHEPENSVQVILDKAGFNNIFDGQFHILGYRDFVAKCREQADVFLEYIDLVRNFVSD